jgi:hypothetical protein
VFLIIGRSALNIIAVIAGINPSPSRGTTNARNARLGNAWRRFAMLMMIKESLEL